MSLDIGQVLGGRYAIERIVGRGTMGIVYVGRDQTTNQHVAIRLIQPEFDNEQVVAFNESEARTAGQLTSIHFARLINIGFLPTGERCIITEYIDGETLKNRVSRLGPLSELQVAQMLLQLLEGLAAAHGASIIHRDLTPYSVMLAPRADGSGDHATLLDFGISRLQALTANAAAAKAAGIDPSSLQYLSPEQLNGISGIDPRSNIYSLGVLAYEALTGRRPFEGIDFSDPALAVLHDDPPPVEELAPASSSPLTQLIRKAMARSPDARFQRADEMTTAISGWIRRAAAAPVAAAQPVAPQPPMPAQLLAQPPAAPAASPARQVPDVAPASGPGVASSPVATPPMPSGITSVPPAPASAPQFVPPTELVPPPMPPAEELAQLAPVQTFSAPVTTRSVAPQITEAAAPAPAQMVPPAMTEQETLAERAPVSTPAVTAPAPPVAGSPIPPPLSPNEAAQSPEIDQSVVDALFAPAPIARRDELFGGTDDQAAAGAVPEATSSPTSERLQPPRLESPSSPTASRLSDGAADHRPSPPEFAAPQSGQAAPGVSSAMMASALASAASAGATPSIAEMALPVSNAGSAAAVEVPTNPDAIAVASASAAAAFVPPTVATGVDGSAQSAAAAAPQQPLAHETAEASSEESSALSKRTILGLGTGGSSGSPPPVEPVAPVAPQAAAAASASALQAPQAAVPAAASAPEALQATARPPQSTAPGIQPSAISSSAPTVPKVGASSVPPQAAAAAPAAVGASSTLDDLGPYGKTQQRSRKALVIALVLVGVVGVGTAIALLQAPSTHELTNKPEANQVSMPAPLPRAADDVQPKPAATPSVDSHTEAASKESAAESGKSGASLSQAMNSGLLSQSVAAAQGKKSVSANKSAAAEKPAFAEKSATAEKPTPAEKPAAVAKTSAAAKPVPMAKPAAKSSAAAPVSKPAATKAAGKDPYNYR